ncbi:MAG: TIGR03619 family F420-dependent LLM class oxidoreductase [Myxococcota bacterium]
MSGKSVLKFAASLAYVDPSELCEIARCADANHWDTLVVSDHLVYPEKIETPYPYTPDGETRWDSQAPWPDPWVAIAAMAAVTERVRFLTGVYVLPLRDPFAVAKAVGTAAIMSHNRVSLGFGVGWMRDEFLLTGKRFEDRGKRTDEMIEVIRTLWKGGMVEFHGDHYDFERLQMTPAPTQTVPLIGGGLSRPALRRVGRVLDGWISDLHTADELEKIIAEIRSYRAEFGRDDEPLQIIAACRDAFGIDGYRRLEEIGVTHVLTMPWMFYSGASATLADKLEGLKRFAGEVIEPMSNHPPNAQ